MDQNTLQDRLVEAFKLLKEPQDNWTYGDWNDWNNRRKAWVNQMNAVMPILNYPIKQAYTLPADEYDDEQPGACCGCE